MKQKLLFLAPSLAIGGAERVLVNLLKSLNYNIYEVTLCLYSNIGVYFSELPNNVNVVHIFSNHFISRLLTYVQRKAGSTYFLRKIVLKRVKGKYDFGICFSDGLLTDVLLMLHDRFNKTLTWVHSCYYSQESLRNAYTPARVKLLKRNRYDLLNGLVFVSSNAMNEFNQIFGQYPNEFCVYNLFDFKGMACKASAFIPEFDKETVNFIAIGRLVKVKEYTRLVEAAKILKNKNLNFKIRILGDGPQRKELINLITEYNLSDTVYLLGFQDNPYPYLKYSDVLVLSSSSEALPTVLVEAMYFSKPIVATKCSGCIEITDRGKYGLLAEHNAADIADKMEVMIIDNTTRSYYASMAAERCQYFNENRTLSQIEKIFSSL